ncbi:MAG: hypothetical protein AB7U79_04685 [Candidatus Izemoplasmatales bacterium]
MEKSNKNIYQENGKYYTTAIQTLDFSDEAIELSFYKEIFDLIHDDEFTIVYDASEELDGFAFICYKHQGKLVVDEAYLEDEVYTVYIDLSVWMYPEMKELTLKERVEMYYKMNEWIEQSKINLVIHGFNRVKEPKKLIEQSEKDQIILSKEQEKRTIIFSYLIQYGLLSLIAIIPLLYLALSHASAIPLYTLGIGLFFYGFYLMLGVLKKWRHVFCVFQSFSRKKRTPNEIYWNTLAKTDVYGIPLIFMILGFVTILAHFLK